MTAENFNRSARNKTGLLSKCKACSKEKVVVPKGFKVCKGGCGEVLEENEHNSYDSKATKEGFSNCCKSCHDARFGKKDDVPDGHQRCKGECGQVLKLSEKNFGRNKMTRSGFQPRCRSCKNAEQRAKRTAARGEKPKQQKRERPREDMPDGHQRCLGECGRVLELSRENFSRNKNARSGFYSICKMCKNAENKLRKAAKKRARVEPEHVEDVPVRLRLSELPRYDDEGVVSD